MSPRRPGHDAELSFEEAAAKAGLKDDFETLFEGASEVAKVNEEKKPLLGRRVTITIERTGAFDALMTDSVRKALIAYVSALNYGNAGNSEVEAMKVNDDTTMLVTHTTFALDVVEPKGAL